MNEITTRIDELETKLAAMTARKDDYKQLYHTACDDYNEAIQAVKEQRQFIAEMYTHFIEQTEN